MPNVKLKIEKAWQEQYYSEHDRHDLAVPPSIRRRYFEPPARPWFPLEQKFRSVGDVRGKDVLCRDCGDDNPTVLLALKEATVWACDISEQAIRLERAMARANGVGGRMVVVVANAEALPFDPASFDIVFRSAILHHVPDSLTAVSKEPLRVLKPGGFAAFSEPVMRGRVLRRIRLRIPVQDGGFAGRAAIGRQRFESA